jgi:hypothetical protein
MVDMVSGASSTGNTERAKPDISSKRGKKKGKKIPDGGIMLTKVTSAKPKRRK